MTFLECAKALETCEVVQLDGQGAWGHIVNLTKKGMVQVRYCGRDRRPRIGVDPSRLTLVRKV